MSTPSELLDMAETLFGEGRDEDALFMLDRYQAELTRLSEESLTRPLDRLPRGASEFRDAQTLAAERAEAIQAEARARVETFGAGLSSDISVADAERREREKLTREVDRERSRVVMAGREKPQELSADGFVRGTRIQNLPGLVLPGDDAGIGEGVLDTSVAGQELLAQRRREAGTVAADAPVGVFERDETMLQPVSLRRYVDPNTGEVSVPTLGQEVREAFTLQTERSEAQMRQEEEFLRLQQVELDRRLREEPETVSWYEKYVGSPGQALEETYFTDPVEGTGVVETPLMAALRSSLSWISAAAAEGYFRGLGYEVDQFGVPKNPDDLGLAIANVRRGAGKYTGYLARKLGLDESAEYIEAMADSGVAYPQAIVKGLVQPLIDLGADPENIGTFTNLIESFLPLAIPLPGIASESTTRKSTTFDPEGRRRVESVEIPDPFTDFKGFLNAEATRIAQNVARGRTWGDEYLDSPETRDYYSRVTGNPDDAFIAGLVPEVILPAGPELLAGPLGYGVGLAADLARVSRGVSRATRLTELQRQSEALQSALTASRGDAPPSLTVKITRADGEEIVIPATDTARLSAEDMRVSQQIDALQRAAGDYDAGYINRIANKAVQRLGISDELTEQASAALKAVRETAISIPDIRRTLEPVLGTATTQRVLRLVSRNIPGDYVMLTDVIAVPRSMLSEAKKSLMTHRGRMFRTDTALMTQRIEGLAARLGEGSSALAAELRAINTDIGSAPFSGSFGYQALPKDLRARLKVAVRQAGKELNEPADFVRRFDQRKPSELFEVDSDLFKELDAYASWDDVPAALRRKAIDAYDYKMPSNFLQSARRKSDLTRAQMWFETAERNQGRINAILRSRFLGNTKLGRKLQRRFGPLETETFAMAQAAREIRAKASTVIRTLRSKVINLTKQHSSFDKAIDQLLSTELAAAGVKPQQAYDKIFGHLYGEQTKLRIMAAAEQRNLLLDGYPTLENLKAIDRLFSSEEGGDLLPGLSAFAPDFTSAILKTVLEDALRPLLSREARDILQAGAAARSLELRGAGGKIEVPSLMGRADESAADFAARSRQELPFPEKGVTVELPESMDTTFGRRMMTYDPTASFIESVLSRGGEELFQILDQIPVRGRKDVLKMAQEYGVDKAIRAHRDIMNRLSYGYIVPNIMGMGAEFLKQAIVPFVTVGARTAINAGGRAVSRVVQRRLGGGGITDPSGVYYSPAMLEGLAESYGIGRSGLEQARTGSLAQDLMSAARRAAKGKGGKLLAGVGEVLDPRQRGFFLRLAEAVELNYRKSVFELSLARGDAPSEAAQLARRSQLDYTQVPDLVQNWMASVSAQAGGLYMLGMEGMAAIIKNPGATMRVLKGMRLKAEAQDPYNVYGDKALKSAGLVGITENDWGKGKMTFFPPKGDVYYLPELPFMAPAEAIIFGARNVDLFIDDVRFAQKVRGEAGAIEAVGEGAMDALRGGMMTVLPAVLDAYDAFADGEPYTTQGVPDAVPMSDEKAFWALALKARANDPNSESGGEWNTFLNTYQPEHVRPPQGMGDPDNPFAWTVQPPEGIPHVLWDINDRGERLYYSFKPSKEGLKRIRALRLLTPEAVEQGLLMYQLSQESGPRETPPREVFAQPVLPETPFQAGVEAVIPRVSMPVQEARRQQSETIRAIRSGE